MFNETSSCDYDIVCFTETRFLEGMPSLQIFDPSFTVHRCDRSRLNSDKDDGGGVLIAANHKYECDRLELSSRCIEAVAVKIRLNSFSIVIYCCYIPPSSSLELYELHASACESLFSGLNGNDIFIACGDFNLPFVNWNLCADDPPKMIPLNVTSAVETSIIDGLAGLGMAQLNWLLNERGRILDLLFCSSPNETSIVRPYHLLTHEEVDHPAVLLTLEVITSTVPPLVDYSEPDFNFRKANFEQVSRFIDAIDWNSIWISCNDLEECIYQFYIVIFIAFELYVPKTMPMRRWAHPPWFNRKLLNLKNRKTNAYRKYAKSGLIGHHELFRHLRRDFVNYRNALYKDFISKTQEDLRRRPKKFFSYVNSKRKHSGLPTSVSFEGKSSSSVLESCQLFADYFGTVYKSDIVERDLFLPPGADHEDCFQFSVEEIYNELITLKPSVSCGPDGIPAVMFSSCAASLRLPLQYLFNRSMRDGLVPSIWKLSDVMPIHKSGSRRLVSNYRSISLQPSLGKLLELLVHNRLSPVIRSRLTTSQHGFMKGRSTSSNLIQFTDVALKTMEHGQQLDTFYADFSKAFDRVNHRILLAKLANFDLSRATIRWIHSYLTNRHQVVRIGNTISSAFPVLSGVPQGSHIGPLLFNLFINDVVDCFPPGSCLLFADDLKLFRRIETHDDCRQLQKNIDDLDIWCSNNDLSLNIDKCFVISYDRSRTPLRHNYLLAGLPLSRQSSIRDLGVLLDEKLSFTEHYNHVVSKAYSMLGFVLRISNEFSDPFVLKSLFISLVRPLLEYGCVVWSPYYAVHSARIESIQKRFVMAALRNLGWRSGVLLPPYIDRLKLIDMHTLESRRNLLKVMFAFDVLTQKLDSQYVSSIIVKKDPPRALRHNEYFRLSSHRTNYGLRNPLASIRRQFNLVSDQFSTSISRQTFKTRCINSNTL